jgi:serpin B
MRALWSLTALVAGALASGLADEPAAAPAAKTDLTTVVAGNNQFAFDLYGQLGREGPADNLFFSPYSISTALAMTYAGARGQTAAQMAKTLHFTLPPERLHDAFAQLRVQLEGSAVRRPYDLYVANRLWGQKGFPFQADFLQLTRTRYAAELAEVDFQQQTEQARQAINRWVEEQTRGKITDLIPPGGLTPQSVLVLTNAIYFKGDWLIAFPEKDTREEDFYLLSGTAVKAPLMHVVLSCPYFANDQLALVCLPYKGQEVEMVVLLPRQREGLPALEKNLGLEQLAGWLRQARPQRVNLALPRFRMTSRLSLEKTLSEMGMPLAFSDQADFRGISSIGKLSISRVLHKAYVDVQEKGTEAAAATGVVVGVTSVGPSQPPIPFRADHPFVLLLRHRPTGSILFLGRLLNPRT